VGLPDAKVKQKSSLVKVTKSSLDYTVGVDKLVEIKAQVKVGKGCEALNLDLAKVKLKGPTFSIPKVA